MCSSDAPLLAHLSPRSSSPTVDYEQPLARDHVTASIGGTKGQSRLCYQGLFGLLHGSGAQRLLHDLAKAWGSELVLLHHMNMVP